MAQPSGREEPFDAARITRPDRALMWYYFLSSLVSGPFFPLVLVPLFFRYETLRYRFDPSGVSMSWGILWRREVHLTYRRIQDIHLTRNIIQRWMGLATVAIQTASGSSGPEMSIEGILQADQLRDFLYSQMRGARGETEPDAAAYVAADVVDGDSTRVVANVANPRAGSDEALDLLREIRDLLRQSASRKGAQP